MVQINKQMLLSEHLGYHDNERIREYIRLDTGIELSRIFGPSLKGLSFDFTSKETSSAREYRLPLLRTDQFHFDTDPERIWILGSDS